MRIDISIEWKTDSRRIEKDRHIQNKSIKMNTFDNITSIRVSSSELTSFILGRL